MSIFSKPFDTLEAAQTAAPRDFFDSSGLFKTPDGKYVHGRLRTTKWTPDALRTIQAGVRQLNGYELIAYTDPIVLLWNDLDGKPLMTSGAK